MAKGREETLEAGKIIQSRRRSKLINNRSEETSRGKKSVVSTKRGDDEEWYERTSRLQDG